MSAKILISHPMTANTLRKLNRQLEVHCISEKVRKYDQVFQIIQHYDALLAMGLRVDNALMDKGKKLKIISNFGVGYDNIDVEYAQKKGIVVANIPNSTTEPSANYTMGLILALLHKIVSNDRGLRQGLLPDWGDRKILGTSPEGKILGIIGMGRIGRAVAKRAIPFGFEIWYYNRNPLPLEMEKEYEAKFVPFNELLQKADIITIHTPLTSVTRHLIGKAQLAMMKKSAFLVNTSRGVVIDQDALVEVLQNREIAGAALDVFAKEPEIPEKILLMDHVIVSPHNATGTVEVRRRMFEESFGNIVAFLNGTEMSSRVV